MAEQRVKYDWSHTSNILALLANCHRDPEKQAAFKASDFDPTVPVKARPKTKKHHVSVLKDIFCR